MTFYFGLNIGRNMSDIVNPRQALLNLNLDTRDLDRLKGITDPGGVTRLDLRSLSGLEVDLEKILGSLTAETGEYGRLTTSLYDDRSFIENNVIVDGQVAATAIKYSYLDSDNTVKLADISTSRVSSWSSFESPVTSTTPIFYGGELRLEGPLELTSLTLNDRAEVRRFESEIPTHKIRVNVDGTNVFLYAMKGIPLIFRGFFRNATISANINQLGAIRPSWTITNTANNFEFIFENRLTNTLSQVVFTDSLGRERDIRFFYPIDRITALSLPSITLSELPSVILPNLGQINISSNDFREFPNFSQFTSLLTINIANNDLTRARDQSLRTFSNLVAARLPSNLRSLTAGNCFSGTSTIDLSGFPLATLNLSTSTRSRRLSGISPKINSATIENYNISSNAFTNVDESVKASLTLRQIILNNNSISASDMRFDSFELERFDSLDNRHNLVDVSGKTKINFYRFRGSVIGASSVTNIFDGCTALRDIDIYGTAITGALPSFLNCDSLQNVDFRFTNVTDALPGFVIGESTFNSCRSTLRQFRVRSSFFTENAEFHPECFRLMSALDYLEMSSNNRGITGPLPSFATARNIRYILLYNNRLTELIPNFDNNDRLFFLNLSNNLFTGVVPNIKATTFQHLILTNNQLDTFNDLESTSIRRIHLAFNNITRIPDLSNLINLQELLINNQRLGGNRFSYTVGSFVGLTSLRTLNITNNSISQGFVDQMILDLGRNYDANPRRNVVINLRGNTAPSDDDEVRDTIRKLQLGGWSVLTD